MKCTNCGRDFEGNFCEWCGTRTQEQESRFEQKIKESFVEPDENLIKILGTNMAKTYFSTGILGNGFAILSDKRMYFKGRCYIRKRKGFFKKMEEKVVDLDNVTGSGFIHNKNMVTTILYYVTLGLFSLCSVFNMFLIPIILWIIYFRSGKEWAKDVAIILCCIQSVGLVALFYVLYKAFNYSLFEVSYAGGGMAFELSWITKEDSDTFNKTLQKTKSEYIKKKKQEELEYIYNPPKDDDKEKSIPELLKEYKELLDSGIITQSEFETKKYELLNK